MNRVSSSSSSSEAINIVLASSKLTGERYFFPPSYQQQGLWLVEQMSPGYATYNIPIGCFFHGELDTKAFEEALEIVIKKYETFRTTFGVIEGSVSQIVWDDVDFSLPYLNVEDETSVDPKVSAISLANSIVQQAFDVTEGPLFRFALIRIHSDETLFVASLHHIMFDGWSIHPFLCEVGDLYTQITVNKKEALSLPVDQVEIQYADYAVWQRERLTQDYEAKLIDFWRQEFENTPAVLELPSDYPRRAVQAFDGDLVEVNFERVLIQQLNMIARDHKTSLYVVTLSALYALLYRYTNQETILIGSPFADRSFSELENAVGFFARTIVLKGDLKNEPTFSELILRVRDSVLAAQENQDLPFELLVEKLQPVRDPAYNPFFQVIFGLQSLPSIPAFGNLERKFVQLCTKTSKFDLCFDLREEPDGLRGIVEFASPLFARDSIVRLVVNYEKTLQEIVKNPNQSIRQISILSEEEKRKLLVDWNDTNCDFSDDQCIHQLFEVQARKSPDAVAVVFGDQRLTYSQLNARANQLAHYLCTRGVGPEVLVGICVERSLEMVIGLLGILKAGGAYVPIDPAYPQERIALMLEDARPVLCLIHAATHEISAVYQPNINLDSEGEAIAQFSTDNPDTTSQPNHLAYVIYTSGSTGRPKGVCLGHRGVVNRLEWMQFQYRLDTNDSILQKTPFSFDVSVWEFFWPILAGAKLVIAPPEAHRDGAHIATLIKNHQITIVHFVPSMLSIFLDTPGISTCRSLRYVICSGEALSVHLQEKFFERLPSVQLHNLYGPTEASIDVSMWACERNSGSISVPIGHPIANTQLYILDRYLNPVPIGVPGELYIGGVGLARGYLNRPELTKERFISNPFSTQTNERLYCTGDLARFREDGAIEYLGRTDFQVKLRGFRIELGEIEAALLQYKCIKEAIAIVREDNPENKQLVAYIVVDQDQAKPEISDIRQQLKQYLPDYMIPAAFVYLDCLPLTSNGKIDRSALPAPNVGEQLNSQYEAPNSHIEKIIADVWAEILHVERVGIHDNFFELGGHSLLAITMLDRLRQQGLHADVRILFIKPTIEEFATCLNEGQVIDVPENRIPPYCDLITPEMLALITLNQVEINHIAERVPGGMKNIQDIYPLASLQEGILYHHLMSSKGDPYLLSIQLVIDTRERLDDFLDALQATINRHDVLRTAVLWEGLTMPVQVVCREINLSAKEVKMDILAGDLAKQFQERYDPWCYRIDVREAPLLRVFFTWDESQQRWLLLILYHHLAIDHVTIELLLEEVKIHLSGKKNQLSKPFPFRNFVSRTNIEKQSDKHENFFRTMLGDVTEPTAPFGLLDILGDGSEISEVTLDIQNQLSRRIRENIRSVGMNVASLFHLAWARVLAQISAKDDVVFGTVLFGRMQGSDSYDRTDQMLGLFINTLPLRVRIDETSVTDALNCVYRLLADLMQCEHTSLALAQRCSAVLPTIPLFSALLNYRHSKDIFGDFIVESEPSWQKTKIVSAKERTNYPITLSVDDFGEDFRLTAQVQAPIDPSAVCQYMHTALESLVDALETEPEKTVCSVNVLPDAEVKKLLFKWNDTNCVFSDDQCIHQLFEVQARKSPDAVAVVFGDQRLTYSQLNARANQLAHYLCTRGVGPEVLVGICVERSLEMVIGLLGILKAGGAYVPIDPAYPQERIALMLEDARPVLCLIHAATHEISAVYQPNINLDSEGEAIAQFSTDNPDTTSQPNHLAYVIYTSGSTGRPKGVKIHHQAVVNFLCSMAKVPGLSYGDKLLAVTTYSFDIAVLELYLPLITGATVVVATREQATNGNELINSIDQKKINVMQATPATWRLLIASGWQGNKKLKALCGGESLQRDLVKNLLPKTDELWNMYGPTEATVWSTCIRITTADGPAFIGKPIDNTQCYVFTENLQPVPVGVPGELYIGGLGVSKGYLNREELTVERFIDNPFSNEKNSKLYRTGDWVKYNNEGELEYIQRLDNQVKVRGFRIELGEIESVIAELEGISHTCVVVREERIDDPRIYAYVVFAQGKSITSTEIRKKIRQKLPDYMIPQYFIELDQLPLMPNGKIDKKALPLPFAVQQHDVGRVAPRNNKEKILVKIWADVLDVSLDQISVQDNFFEIGGHSLLSMQVISRLGDFTKTQINPRDIIFSTLEQIAEKCEFAE